MFISKGTEEFRIVAKYRLCYIWECKEENGEMREKYEEKVEEERS